MGHIEGAEPGLEGQLAAHWEAVLLDGNIPLQFYVRVEDLESDRARHEIPDNLPATTYNGVPVVPVRPREYHRLESFIICRHEDAEQIAGVVQTIGIECHLAILEPGGCWLLAEQGRGVADCG